jgi:hypothetical protein
MKIKQKFNYLIMKNITKNLHLKTKVTTIVLNKLTESN